MFRSCDHHQGAALFLAKITLLKTQSGALLETHDLHNTKCYHNTKLL